MASDRMSRQEAIESVLVGLQALILMSANRAAGEQYSPSPDVDASDDTIRDRKKEMAELRAMRAEFENLATGVLVDARCWELRLVFSNRELAREAEERMKEHLPGVAYAVKAVW